MLDRPSESGAGRESVDIRIMNEIIDGSIRECLPDEAVKRSVRTIPKARGKRALIAVGKAAWRMAKAAIEAGVTCDEGAVITKYGHVGGELPGIRCFEAGHPVPDGNTLRATRYAMSLVSSLGKEDQALFLLSGGGSSLFEEPLIPMTETEEITRRLLACGADIVEINTIRKRLSAVKAGRFARLCAPAEVFNIILSDVVGNKIDMIASGPTVPDESTARDALEIVRKYGIPLSRKAEELLRKETPKALDNVRTTVSGSVEVLCEAAREICEKHGFRAEIRTASMSGIAREEGKRLARLARENADTDIPLAFLFGGETVVLLTGKGKGGRNQEIALSAAEELSGLDNVLIFSFGSDGTDGPTDAAGGWADGETKQRLEERGLRIPEVLAENDSYRALDSIGHLIRTGPTGTNVNDLSVVLIAPRGERWEGAE